MLPPGVGAGKSPVWTFSVHVTGRNVREFVTVLPKGCCIVTRMWNRFIVAMGVLAATSQAWSSYDLLLQFDSDATNGDHIDRYDPISRIYLGSFQIQNTIDALAMVASTARREVYVRRGSTSMEAYNYDTGDQTRSFSFVGDDLFLSNDQRFLYSNNSTFIRRYDLDTRTSTTITLAGATSIGAATINAAGEFVVAENTANEWRVYSASGVLLRSQAFSEPTEDIRTIALSPHTTPGVTQYRGLSGLNRVQTLTDAGSVLSSDAFTLSGIFSANSVASAHLGAWMTGDPSTGGGTLKAFRMGQNNTQTTGFSLTQTTLLTAPTAVVLAPEPGTMIALGAGAVALLRRRQRTRS